MIVNSFTCVLTLKIGIIKIIYDGKAISFLQFEGIILPPKEEEGHLTHPFNYTSGHKKKIKRENIIHHDCRK